MSERITPEDLMRYLDGEMPPEERARMDAGLERSTELQRELAIYRAMRRDFQDLSFAPVPRSRSVWDRVNRRLTRPLGWFFLLAGAAAWTGYGAWLFVLSPADLAEKLAVGAVVIGVLLLLAAVLWERYREWLTDPYRHVQR